MSETKNKTIYIFELSIGYANANREKEFNVLDEYELEVWQAMNDEEREAILDKELDNWSQEYIETKWS